MAAEDTPGDAGVATDGEAVAVGDADGDGADAAVDEGIVDLLTWVLDTEARARIYLYLRQCPESTSDEIASGTGLYPSTVREALAELHADGTVDRSKRASSGAGNNPYEYTALAPADLVTSMVDGVEAGLNTVFNLDRHLRGEEGAGAQGPVTISVEREDVAQPGDD